MPAVWTFTVAFVPHLTGNLASAFASGRFDDWATRFSKAAQAAATLLHGDTLNAHCAMLAATTWCLLDPLWMAEHCSGHCEEDRPQSTLRRRGLVEGVLSADECKTILALAREAAVPGDGYGGNAFPFSEHERFSGLEPSAAAQWAMAQPEQGGRREFAVRAARGVVEASRRAKQTAEQLLSRTGRNQVLDYVQLSCRESMPAATGSWPRAFEVYEINRAQIFADNCWRRGNECVRASPSYHWRNFSVTLFLQEPAASNDETDDPLGGDFFYTAHWSGAHQTVVLPHCGRMVVHDSGPSNIHGVMPLLKGRFCTLNLYLTESGHHAAHHHELDQADAILNGETIPMTFPYDFTQNYYERCAKLADGGSQSGGKPEGNTRDGGAAQLNIEIDGVQMRVVEESHNPQVTRIEGFLGPEEMEALVNMARPNMQDSTVFEGGELTTAKYRSSKTAWLRNFESDVVARIERRIAILTGLSMESAEELQIAYYSSGALGRYEPHFDWGNEENWTLETPSGTKDVGVRVATFLMYLNTVTSGGHTLFTEVNLSFAPSAGTALFWYNYGSDGRGLETVRHGACPVLGGEKYIATKWIHALGNEYVFAKNGVTAGNMLARSWPKVASAAAVQSTRSEERVRTNVEHDVTQSVMFLPETCKARQDAGECTQALSKMSSYCPGFCVERSPPPARPEPTLAQDDLSHGASEARPSSQRMVVAGLLKSKECQTVLKLAEYCKAGDGYDGNAQPFSEYEEVAGLTPMDAVRWAASQPSKSAQRSMATASARALVDAARVARVAVESWLNASGSHPEALEFDFIHFVCRRSTSRTEPLGSHSLPDSHKAHADNCWFDVNGRCRAEPPYYWWRSHSAVLFLHDADSGDFEGGDFFFEEVPGTSLGRDVVKPACGRLVAFTAGAENVHGVAPVAAGQRCALALWFTTDRLRAGAAGELHEAELQLGELEPTPSAEASEL